MVHSIYNIFEHSIKREESWRAIFHTENIKSLKLLNEDNVPTVLRSHLSVDKIMRGMKIIYLHS